MPHDLLLLMVLCVCVWRGVAQCTSVNPVPLAVMWTLIEHLERRIAGVHFAHKHTPIADRLQGSVVVDHR
uniref:Putative secreted protein n=1 Tax=Anopheles darlingi TaxID=43151 RepID=A0A2M4D2S2_ANODA